MIALPNAFFCVGKMWVTHHPYLFLENNHDAGCEDLLTSATEIAVIRHKFIVGIRRTSTSELFFEEIAIIFEFTICSKKTADCRSSAFFLCALFKIR
ncbi:MAG: hypothetical protein ACI90V_007831 [Bacillariaceae sp.]|jgi:hypothetical protein